MDNKLYKIFQREVPAYIQIEIDKCLEECKQFQLNLWLKDKEKEWVHVKFSADNFGNKSKLHLELSRLPYINYNLDNLEILPASSYLEIRRYF